MAEQRRGREGNRWINETPSAEDLATWFSSNVKVADGMAHEDYVGGVVLIPATEKAKTVTGWDGVTPLIEDVEALVFTPYIRVETRLKYFHDLCEKEDWQGFIEPAKFERQDARLPSGFFRHVVATGEGRESRYLACSMQVVIYEKGSIEEKVVILDKRTGEQGVVRTGKIVRVAPAGTKAVPMLRYGRNSSVYADDNAVMKAETGAIGRALGMAGMLVIPGSGIATAEDVQEARAAEAAGPTPAEPELPDDELPSTAPRDGAAVAADDDAALRSQATEILAELAKVSPEAHVEFKRWAAERGHTRLSEVTSPALRGLVKKAENMLEDARKSVKPASPDPLTS